MEAEKNEPESQRTSPRVLETKPDDPEDSDSDGIPRPNMKRMRKLKK